ncbi:MAG: KEOPS complex subunit Pcc1 [Methanobacteriota archaeon]
MNACAQISTKSENPKCVMKALSVDNKAAEIDSKVGGKTIKTEVKANNPRTLLATVDDIIRCQMVAEKIIEDG